MWSKQAECWFKQACGIYKLHPLKCHVTLSLKAHEVWLFEKWGVITDFDVFYEYFWCVFLCVQATKQPDSYGCLFRNGGCDHFCTDTNSSHVCSCAAGYSLGPDNSSCIAQSECECEARKVTRLSYLVSLQVQYDQRS